jgi:hypothetical protein
VRALAPSIQRDRNLTTITEIAQTPSYSSGHKVQILENMRRRWRVVVWLDVLLDSRPEGSVLFISTQFSNLYTAVDTPAGAA